MLAVQAGRSYIGVMLYSIQNSTGRVYGIFPVPPSTKSAEGLAHELKAELGDILGTNSVRDAPLYQSATETFEDRVVIDIQANVRNEAERLARVHETIGRLTTPPPEI